MLRARMSFSSDALASSSQSKHGACGQGLAPSFDASRVEKLVQEEEMLWPTINMQQCCRLTMLEDPRGEATYT